MGRAWIKKLANQWVCVCGDPCRMHTTLACRLAYPSLLVVLRPREPLAHPQAAQSVTWIPSASRPTPSPMPPEKVATTPMAQETSPPRAPKPSHPNALKHTPTPKTMQTTFMGAPRRAPTKSHGALRWVGNEPTTSNLERRERLFIYACLLPSKGGVWISIYLFICPLCGNRHVNNMRSLITCVNLAC